MMPNWRLEWPHITVIVLLFTLAAIVWPYAPAKIPSDNFVHPEVSVTTEGPSFDFEPIKLARASAALNEGSISKFPGLLIMPLAALVLEIGLLLIPWVDPGRPNYDQFAGAYAILRFAFIAFIAALYLIAVLQLFGYPINRHIAMTILQALVFIVIGNLLGKVRPNWFVGIHNPWTLSSKLSWDRTHRVGGWMFMILGATFAVSVLFPIVVGAALTAAVVVVIAIGLTIYSFVLWRADPDKIPPAGTLPG